jgi:hypothetical protein
LSIIVGVAEIVWTMIAGGVTGRGIMIVAGAP